MKKLLTIILFFVFALSPIKGEKHAFLIGVGEYPTESGWRPLSSSNDLDHLSEGLKLRGFKAENIFRIENQLATRQGILSAFQTFEKRIRKGDIIYIHFSGHGQQVVDDNRDEIDQLDEAIVPYDSYKDYKTGMNEGGKLIRDDELNSITKKIRKKVGKNGQIVFVIDACHSGTGTRGQKGRYRGTNVLMAPDNFLIDEEKATIEPSMKINSNQRSFTLAPMACYFASSANEANKEARDDQNRPIGSLSYTVAKLLSQTEKSLTFEEFFERIQLRMKTLVSKQHPQWEGPKNKKLFSGNTSDSANSLFNITERSGLILKAEIGTIIGVFQGSQIEVYSLDQQKVVGSGYVSNADLASSVVTLNEPLNIKFDELLKIRITGKSQPLIKVAIAYEMPTSKLEESLKRYRFIHPVAINPELSISLNNEGNLILQTAYGTELFEEEYDDNEPEEIKYELLEAIKSYTQGKYLRDYHNESSDFRFTLKILKANCEKPTAKIQQLKTISNSEVRVGSCIQLAVKNEGSKPGYFSVLDIQPDNQLNLLIPVANSNYKSSDFYLNPGQSYLTDYTMTIGKPIGEETIKLICTDKPLRLNKIIKRRGAAMRNENDLHPFEKILSASFLNEETRGENASIGLEAVGTKTQFFRIIK